MFTANYSVAFRQNGFSSDKLEKILSRQNSLEESFALI